MRTWSRFLRRRAATLTNCILERVYFRSESEREIVAWSGQRQVGGNEKEWNGKKELSTGLNSLAGGR